MRIAGIYSFNGGKEAINRYHKARLEEVLQVIDAVNAEKCKMKVSKEKTMRDRVLYSPPDLNKAFKEQFAARHWMNYKVTVEYSTQYYVPGYNPRSLDSGNLAPSEEMDFVKEKLGIDIQLSEDVQVLYSICTKMTIFANMGVINCGIEIVPVKALAEEMSTGVSYFEQFVWDLEHRGVSNIDIPVLILGIDTDGAKPRELKIAEPRPKYLFD